MERSGGRDREKSCGHAETEVEEEGEVEKEEAGVREVEEERQRVGGTFARE